MKNRSIVAAALSVGMVLGGAAVFAVATGESQDQLLPAEELCVQVVGEPGDFAILNVTMVEASGPGFVVLRSSDAASENNEISSGNFDSGTVDPNVTITQIGVDRQVCLDNSNHSSVHAIVDQLAVIDNSVIQPVNERIADTRVAGPELRPDAVCLAPNAVTSVDLVNRTGHEVLFAYWAVLRSSNLTGDFQIDTDLAGPRLVHIDDGVPITVPPIAHNSLEPGAVAPIGIKAPPTSGQYELTDLVVSPGQVPSLTITVSENCR